MKKLLLFAIILTIVVPITLMGQQKVPTKIFSRVGIKVQLNRLQEFFKLGLPIDECEKIYKEDHVYFKVPLTQYDIELLKKSGYPYKIEIENVEEFYSSRYTARSIQKAEEYRRALGTEMKLGSMGGFYTMEEIEANLDYLFKKYGTKKKLITKKKSIGKSYEGRDIYMIKISDNANKDEDNEPQVLYTALTHAREPAGMMTIFYFMYYLLENYETDNRVRSIVDNHELYFIPVVNPDGYAYNQKTRPNGGGMQRKNRNGNGIDLNRNFGPQELWDYPNGGSSTSSWSQTYRGTAPFSEKETKALWDFITSKNFKTALNYHTYSNLLLYPWGFKNEIADPMLDTMAQNMTKINGYRYGTPGSILYSVRGDSDSCYYKLENILALTAEVGSRYDGFWPDSDRIFPLAQENLEMNLLLVEYSDKVPSKK